uniref:Lipocalin/cytosolic fatty-acid binding domain-containing protein n=1 Tax=Timema bartmani TaxID=61472 RepID=A0A7R9I6K3_9NEOP|nr:unnamed protein product [Timema bartmani]
MQVPIGWQPAPVVEGSAKNIHQICVQGEFPFSVLDLYLVMSRCTTSWSELEGQQCVWHSIKRAGGTTDRKCFHNVITSDTTGALNLSTAHYDTTIKNELMKSSEIIRFSKMFAQEKFRKICKLSKWTIFARSRSYFTRANPLTKEDPASSDAKYNIHDDAVKFYVIDTDYTNFAVFWLCGPKREGATKDIDLTWLVSRTKSLSSSVEVEANRALPPGEYVLSDQTDCPEPEH